MSLAQATMAVKHQDHLDLLRRAVTEHPGRWADFGSGAGAFTLALRDLLGPDTEIFSIEKDRARLQEQRLNFAAMFPQSNVHFLHADFTLARRHEGAPTGNYPIGIVTTCEEPDLPALDGIVMANTLHFFPDKERVLHHLRDHLKPNGRFVLIEYNVDAGNLWVPHPISFNLFRALALRAGFSEPRLLATKPSRFLREMYSACAIKNLPQVL